MFSDVLLAVVLLNLTSASALTAALFSNSLVFLSYFPSTILGCFGTDCCSRIPVDDTIFFYCASN